MIVSPGSVSAAYTAMFPSMLATSRLRSSTQRLDLVDVARAREPAVDGTDVAFRRALADLGREEPLHGRRDERLRGEQVDALTAAPPLVPLDRRDHLLLHLRRRRAGVEELARLRQCLRVVDFRGRGDGHLRLLSERLIDERTEREPVLADGCGRLLRLAGRAK